MLLFPTIYVIFWSISMALIAAVAALPTLGWDFRLHMLGGLAAAFVNCLLHTAVMIHLVGQGRSIKDALPWVKSPRRDYSRDQTAIKTSSYPLSTVCCVLACTTAILGGGRNFGVVPWQVHMGFAVALAAANLVALPLQLRVIKLSGSIVTELEAELETVVKEMEKDGKLPEVMPWQA
jgi:hypothetical protein